ncbi:hypothetical protein DFQ04_1125 [Algoriphagus boseongensis]|uniref:Uncharacterized protein n=1 Tax=Algoriphagus boseongensis TaxID=1442587 RepID=A0A4R6TCX9_9BACT|nr:hypothetical protein [Algoriphagus boseongensis]TDQ19304.1 hypothetical protein DFQ04_1125 [Algoriphagus boseongensis]
MKLLKWSLIMTYFLVLGTQIKAQQFNSDNYLTMPHGTGTFILTYGERNATMYSVFALKPRFELNVQANLFWENKDQPTNRFTSNIYGKYMFWVNKKNNGGGAVFLGIGQSRGYYSESTYSAMHKNYWTAVPITFPLFHDNVFLDLMPGGLIDFDYGNSKKTALGFTYSSRLAIYKIIPRSAIVGEVYGTAGKANSPAEYKAGIRFEPNDFVVVAATYGGRIDGNKASGFELGLMIFTPQFLKKDFIKNNDIKYD